MPWHFINSNRPKAILLQDYVCLDLDCVSMEVVKCKRCIYLFCEHKIEDIAALILVYQVNISFHNTQCYDGTRYYN